VGCRYSTFNERLYYKSRYNLNEKIVEKLLQKKLLQKSYCKKTTAILSINIHVKSLYNV